MVAKIEILNQTQAEQSISTRDIGGSFNTQEFVRPYKMTIASNVIDFSSVILKPDDKLMFNVYWPVGLPIGTKITSWKFKCGDLSTNSQIPPIFNLYGFAT